MKLLQNVLIERLVFQRLSQNADGRLSLLVILLRESSFQSVLILFDESNNPVDNKPIWRHRIFCQFQVADIGRHRIIGVCANPCIYTICEEMPTQDVLCFEEASWCGHFTLHHFFRISKIIHIMRLSCVSIVQHKSGTFLTTSTTYTLEEIAWFRRYICITHYIQVADVDTHFQCRCCRENIDRIWMRMLLEVLLKLFSVQSFQQARMFPGIHTRRQSTVINLLIIVELRVYLLWISSLALVVKTEGIFCEIITLGHI